MHVNIEKTARFSKGLIFVCASPKTLYVEIANSNVMVSDSGAFGRELGHEGEPS